jgi:prepilin-type N-terminal cleavage/methylation domain-containing protein
MKKEKSSRGFTLIELLVSMTLLGVALGSLYQIFLSQAEAYRSQAMVVQRQQGLRASLELIARDSRSAGYPVLDQSFLKNLSDWTPNTFLPKVPQTVIPNGVLTITPGGNNPDTLSLLIVLSSETNPTSLSQGTLAGDTSIKLALTASETNDQFNVGDMLYLGKPPELAQVKEILGNVLVLDTDPVLSGNQGLKKAYPAGTELGEISLVSYAVFNDQNDSAGKYHDLGVPVLKRKINAGGFEPLAEGITDLKITPIKPDLFRLQLSVSPGLPRVGSQVGPGKIMTLSTQFMKRN